MKKFILICTLVLITSCKADPLKFIGEYEFLTDTSFHSVPLGGLSGLAMNSNGNLVAISDDRGKYDHPRYVEFKIELEEGKLSLAPKDMLYLKNIGGRDFINNQLDPEDIVILNDKNFFIVSEKNLKGDLLKPEIIKFNHKGILIEPLEIPTDFIVEGNKGIRRNKGFESLAISADEKFLFVANEDALLQDGDAASINHGSKLRLLKYEKKGNRYEYDKYFTYPLSKVPNPTGLKSSKYADNGLVALVHIADNEFYSLERSFVYETKKNYIKIFKVKIDEAKGAVSKELMLDLEKILPKLKLGTKRLDNMEGMCLGPKLKNGNQTLILVSDNNFSKRQRTLFLAFEIK